MKKSILVIDDDSLARNIITAVLEGEGHAVAAFPNFDEALQTARQTLPDLILIDVVMPEISGYDACHKIKEMFRPHPPAVIVMTGTVNSVDPIRAQQMGADDFVPKTSDMSIVTQAVRNIFSRKNRG